MPGHSSSWRQAEGRVAEVHLAKDLEAQGFLVGSRRTIAGPGDLLAVRGVMELADMATVHREIRLIEVKTSEGGPFVNFKLSKRVELWAAAERIHATAWLAWRPYRSWNWAWYPPSDWPSTPAPVVWGANHVEAVTDQVRPRRLP